MVGDEAAGGVFEADEPQLLNAQSEMDFGNVATVDDGTGGDGEKIGLVFDRVGESRLAEPVSPAQLELPGFDFPTLIVEELESSVGPAGDGEDVLEVEGDLGELGMGETGLPDMKGRRRRSRPQRSPLR
jgi:hypothetical protein